MYSVEYGTIDTSLLREKNLNFKVHVSIPYSLYHCLKKIKKNKTNNVLSICPPLVSLVCRRYFFLFDLSIRRTSNVYAYIQISLYESLWKKHSQLFDGSIWSLHYSKSIVFIFSIIFNFNKNSPLKLSISKYLYLFDLNRERKQNNMNEIQVRNPPRSTYKLNQIRLNPKTLEKQWEMTSKI